MRIVDTAYFSEDECWGVQIGGLQHCQENCKWIGISACEGENIRQTGYNSKGYRIGEIGLISEDYKPGFDSTSNIQKPEKCPQRIHLDPFNMA